MSERRNAMFVYCAPAHLPRMLVSQFGVLQRLPGEFLPGLMILFLMGFGGASMCVGGGIVQLGGSLMIFVMRSVVITSRHL